MVDARVPQAKDACEWEFLTSINATEINKYFYREPIICKVPRHGSQTQVHAGNNTQTITKRDTLTTECLKSKQTQTLMELQQRA